MPSIMQFEYPCWQRMGDALERTLDSSAGARGASPPSPELEAIGGGPPNVKTARRATGGNASLRLVGGGGSGLWEDEAKACGRRTLRERRRLRLVGEGGLLL